jgi:hypothetical protein
MNTPKIDVPDVRRVLDEVVAERPDHRDVRVDRRLAPRYTEHGSPACLVAEIMHRLGVSIGVLKALDTEADEPEHRAEGGVQLDRTRHPVRSRFTDIAWQLLAFLQRRNDWDETWLAARNEAFTPRDMWGNVPGPWCTEADLLSPDDAVTSYRRRYWRHGVKEELGAQCDGVGRPWASEVFNKAAVCPVCRRTPRSLETQMPRRRKNKIYDHKKGGFEGIVPPHVNERTWEERGK